METALSAWERQLDTYLSSAAFANGFVLARTWPLLLLSLDIKYPRDLQLGN